MSVSPGVVRTIRSLVFTSLVSSDETYGTLHQGIDSLLAMQKRAASGPTAVPYYPHHQTPATARAQAPLQPPQPAALAAGPALSPAVAADPAVGLGRSGGSYHDTAGRAPGFFSGGAGWLPDRVGPGLLDRRMGPTSLNRWKLASSPRGRLRDSGPGSPPPPLKDLAVTIPLSPQTPAGPGPVPAPGLKTAPGGRSVSWPSPALQPTPPTSGGPVQPYLTPPSPSMAALRRHELPGAASLSPKSQHIISPGAQSCRLRARSLAQMSAGGGGDDDDDAGAGGGGGSTTGAG